MRRPPTPDAALPFPGVCRYCGRPRPRGYAVTCARSECQEAAYLAGRRPAPRRKPAPRQAASALLKLTHAGQTASPQAVAIGLELARKVFARRGDRAEVQLAEVTLAAMLAIAAERGVRWRLADDEPARLERACATKIPR